MAKPRASSWARALAVVASVLVGAGATDVMAKSAPKKPAPPVEPSMRVYLVRSAQDGCEPNCPEWIAAQGKIDAQSLGRFKKVLGQVGKRNLPVLVHSGGGLADEGLAIGRLLRKRGLSVGVAKTAFTPCAPEDTRCRKKEGNKPLRGVPDIGYSVCASACVFVFAGGVSRFAGLLSLVGVHKSILIQSKVLYTYKMRPYRARDGSVRVRRELVSEKVVGQRQISAPQKTYDRYEKYFREMDVGKEIMPLMLGAPNTSIHWLTPQELRTTHIATHRMDGWQLVRGDTAPDNGWGLPFTPVGPTPQVPAAAEDCTKSGTGCPWQFTPTPKPAVEPFMIKAPEHAR